MTPRYRIVWQDPAEPDAPVKVTHPAPAWLDEVMAIGLSEEQAMELLVMKVLPRAAWDPTVRRNRPLFAIVPRTAIPSDRSFRNAWRLVEREAVYG